MARVGAILAATAMVLSGCGSSSQSNHEASKPPAQIVADAAAALRRAGSYVMNGTLRHGRRTGFFMLAVAGPQSFRITEGSRSVAVEVIEVPGAFYLRGNEAYWRAHARFAPRAVLLADRWIQVPLALERRAISELGRYGPRTLSRCIVEDNGTLSTAGESVVEGRRAIIISAAGNVPGSGPGELAVAATGPPYPLKATGTGPTKPGGPVDVCNDGRGSNVTSVVTFSHFGTVPPIRRPAPILNPGPGV